MHPWIRPPMHHPPWIIPWIPHLGQRRWSHQWVHHWLLLLDIRVLSLHHILILSITLNHSMTNSSMRVMGMSILCLLQVHLDHCLQRSHWSLKVWWIISQALKNQSKGQNCGSCREQLLDPCWQRHWRTEYLQLMMLNGNFMSFILPMTSSSTGFATFSFFPDPTFQNFVSLMMTNIEDFLGSKHKLCWSPP